MKKSVLHFVFVLIWCSLLLVLPAAAAVTLTSPNGGESWELGSGQTITWSFSDPGTYEFVRIFLLKEGSFVGEIFGNNAYIPIGTGGIGSKYWGIPLSEPTLPAGDDYQIYLEYVCNPYPCLPPSNMSGYFSLITPPPPTITVTSPNGGEIWQRGSNQTIMWSYTGDPGDFVYIWLRKSDLVVNLLNPPLPDVSIGTNGQGSFTWQIDPEGSTGNDYTIEIFPVGNPNIIDSSNGYFTLTPTGSVKIGIFRPSSGIWSLDSNGNFVWEGSDKSLSWGLPSDIPVIGDWNGDGKDDIGIFRPSSGIWSLDSNGNSTWEVSDKSVSWGLPGDIPVIGDWNNGRKDNIGIFRPSSGIWSLDLNGNYIWEPSDKSISWGLPGDIPVVGDWKAWGKDDIGIFRPSSGIWSLDSNGNSTWEDTDMSLSWGLPNDKIVIGDWNGDGKDDIGIFRPTSGIWSLDSNGNFIWEPSDKSVSWGLPGDIPVIGDWNADGKDDIGIFRPSSGIWSLDSNGNFEWEVSDKSLSWGLPNDKPVVGKY